jgi:hypothetical protein
METNKRPFTATVHIVLVILMLAGIVMIGQQLSLNIYQIGLIVLTAATIVQIAFGNIPGSYTFRRAMKLFWPFMAIILFIFVLSFILVPIMYALGR